MSSHRQIFRSSAVIGSASIISILIGVINVKVIAVLLGASSVGLLGIYQNVIGVASTFLGFGVSRSGVRELALNANSSGAVAAVRRSLIFGTLGLGLAGIFVICVFRERISGIVFGDVEHANAVAVLSLGVLISLMGGAQTAVLQGLRKIKHIAQVNILGALISSALGVSVIYTFRDDGLIWFVLIAPLISMVLSGYFASALVVDKSPVDLRVVYKKFEGMLKLGVPLMLATLVNLTAQLIVRSTILRDFGSDASGHFQASWTISMTYIGFVLGAMVTDFFPRLSEAIADQRTAKVLVDDQAEMALLLAGPVLLIMNVFAPLVMQLLYSDSFVRSAEILRWQILGDILKVASWPMGFILVAMGRSGLTLFSEVCWCVIYVAFVYFVAPHVGLFSVGIGFFLAYLVFYLIVAILSRRLIGYVVSKRLAIYTVALLVLNAGVSYSMIRLSAVAAVSIGVGVFIFVTAFSLYRLNNLLNLGELIKKRL